MLHGAWSNAQHAVYPARLRVWLKEIAQHESTEGEGDVASKISTILAFPLIFRAV